MSVARGVRHYLWRESGRRNVAGAVRRHSQQISVEWTPSSMTPESGFKAFHAVLTGTTTNSVTWAVNDTPGGSPATGLITVAGIYTPPAPPRSKTNPNSATDARQTPREFRAVTLALRLRLCIWNGE